MAGEAEVVEHAGEDADDRVVVDRVARVLAPDAAGTGAGSWGLRQRGRRRAAGAASGTATGAIGVAATGAGGAGSTGGGSAVSAPGEQSARASRRASFRCSLLARGFRTTTAAARGSRAERSAHRPGGRHTILGHGGRAMRGHAGRRIGRDRRCLDERGAGRHGRPEVAVADLLLGRRDCVLLARGSGRQRRRRGRAAAARSAPPARERAPVGAASLAVAVSVTLVPQPEAESSTVPRAISPSHVTVVSGTSRVIRISPKAPRCRANASTSLISAHSSGGDLTRVRCACCWLIGPWVRRRGPQTCHRRSVDFALSFPAQRQAADARSLSARSRFVAVRARLVASSRFGRRVRRAAAARRGRNRRLDHGRSGGRTPGRGGARRPCRRWRAPRPVARAARPSAPPTAVPPGSAFPRSTTRRSKAPRSTRRPAGPGTPPRARACGARSTAAAPGPRSPAPAAAAASSSPA